MYRMFSLTLATLSLLVAFVVVASGQVTGGAVTGVVTDVNAAAIPNAAVRLRQTATGLTLESQTTSTGSYNFPNVQVGEYTLTASASGFESRDQPIRVVLNQTTSANVTLQPAGVEGTVVVTAASDALVQTDSSQLGKTYDARMVEGLPIFGNQNTLGALSPNVVLQPAGAVGAGGSVGGIRPRYNSFMVDGVDNNQFSVTGPATTVIQDAVAEFTLLTNNYNAEFGSASGGQFNTITKSGTNEYHGNGFLYMQREKLNAASTSQERLLNLPANDPFRIASLPRFRNTRYGMTLGGPIMRDRLFFFFAYQHETNSRQVAGSSFVAPTPQGLAQLAAVPGVSPFMINLLQQNLILPATADSTRTILGQTVPFGTVSVVNPGGFNDHQFQINIDHLRGTRDQFRYRFSSDRFRSEGATGLGNPQFNNLTVFDSRLFSATWVRTISASIVNDLRLSYRKSTQDFPLKDPAFNTFPNLSARDFNINLGPQSNLPQGQFSHNYQIYDTVNYVRGNHSFKFGGEYRNLIATSQFLPRGRGDYLYVTFADLIQDLLPTFDPVRGVGSAAYTFNQQKFYVFGQDDWKVTPNLTLNLGLRYEYVQIPRDAALQALNSIANLPGVVEFNVPKSDRNNIAPRVGFAYAPHFESGLLGRVFGERGRSALRANFAMSYGEVFGNLPLLTLPPQFQQELRPPNVPGFNTSPGFLERGGLPSTPNPPTTPAAARAASSSYTSDFIQPETYSWALSWQRELTTSTAIEFRYLGTRSRHLPVQVWKNPAIPPPLTMPTFFSQPTAGDLAGLTPLSTLLAQRQFVLPQFSIMTTFDPIGNSQYDGGAVSVTRRFSRGLAFTAAYTFSKTIDDSTNEVFSSVANPRRPQNFLNMRDQRGLSDLDIPHRLAIAFNYELPFFRESGSGFARQVLGGWGLGGIFQAQSGQPFTPQSGVDSNLNFDAAGDRTILNLNGVSGTGSKVCAVNSAGQILAANGATQIDGQPVTVAQCGISTAAAFANAAVAYFAANPNAQYIQAGFGAQTTAGRNTLRSNGFNRTDAALKKEFFFGADRYRFEVGAEVNNLFNQRIRTIGNFANALGTPTAPGLAPTDFSFPNVSSPLFNDYSIGNFPGRTIQLRAKLIF